MVISGYPGTPWVPTGSEAPGGRGVDGVGVQGPWGWRFEPPVAAP